ncbi:TIGR01777 family oxidoreductase [Flagellimonas myxillae]|uniref:TIGR01777 family oxidoreductase n=1 Tax=Flagellimonas myxillae TaxID=2942214 RepID=UPI00201F7830|nr:TIGR01777 family oxidoreductase [Muricauda myxillae]MCL6265209.1 TIGR01777 family oxidoreductase [Muricauda myxillae]
MKVLITGATGLVGQEIVKVLNSEGATVHYLTRNKKKISTSDNYKGFYWDPSKRELDVRSLDGVSAIINLAGSSIANRWTKSHKARVLESRVNSLLTLKKALEKVNVSHIKSFVSASAIGIYPHSLTKLYNENEEGVDKSFLGDVVAQWEDTAKGFKDFGFNVSLVRIGIVLSNQGGALPKMARPIKNYAGAAFGSGEQWQSWIHITDLAQMFVYIVTQNLKGTFNGVAPNPVTQSKMTKILANVLQRPLWLPNIPKFIMKGLLGEMSYLLFSSQRVSSKRIEKKGFVFTYSNLEPALINLYEKREVKSTDTP